MKRTLLILAAMLALSAAVLLGKDKKSNILDAAAFEKVQSYCTETADLPPQYVQIVQSFFAHQTKPKSVVNQLAWKKVDDCSAADAVMAFRFSSTSEVEDTAGSHGFAPAGVNAAPVTYFEAKILVADRASKKPIYEGQGPRAPERGEEALQNTFKQLAKDLK